MASLRHEAENVKKRLLPQQVGDYKQFSKKIKNLRLPRVNLTRDKTYYESPEIFDLTFTKCRLRPSYGQTCH